MTVPTEVLDALLTRHSARGGFLARSVPRDVIERIVACGEAAPSSKNAQPWRFHVVTERQQIEALSDCVIAAEGIDNYVPRDPRTGRPRPEYASTVRESADLLREAPAAVWIENLGPFSSGRGTLASVSAEARAGSLVASGFEFLGIGAAIENMWIAANLLGLGASFMGDVVVAEAAIQSTLGFNNDLVGVLVIGHCHVLPRSPSRLTRAFPELPRVVWHD